MKTRELRHFYQELSELNNSFTHYSFVWNQFSLDYLDTIKTKSEVLTKDFFNTNPYKNKHNIRLIDLDKEHAKTNTTLIQGIFLLIYSHYESYLKGILDFSQQISEDIKSFESKLEDVESDSVLLDKVLNRLSIDKGDFIPELLNTLDYMRLKRNRLTHKNSENISKTLNHIIKSVGEHLNKFWDANLPSQRQGVDFINKENANTLNFNIVVDTLNIFRKLTADIDSKIIDKLTFEKITVKYIIPEFLDKHHIKHLNLERKISKFKRYCEAEFSFKVSNNIIEILKSSIA